MKELKLNQNTGINLPIGNLISIIGACLVAAWFGFSIIERVNKLETQTVLMEKDALKDISDIQEELKESRHNATNISRLQKDVERLMQQLELIKDKVRANGNSH